MNEVTLLGDVIRFDVDILYTRIEYSYYSVSQFYDRKINRKKFKFQIKSLKKEILTF